MTLPNFVKVQICSHNGPKQNVPLFDDPFDGQQLEVDLESGNITNGAELVPTILSGFFSSRDSPTEVGHLKEGRDSG